MYMHYWGGSDAWFINMPLWAAPVLGVVMILALWTLFWKGLALWHAARRGEQWWFLALLLVNTAGILEIIYLFVVAKLKFDELFSKHDHHTK